MPIDIKVNQIEVRNPRSNEYIPIDVVTTNTVKVVEQKGEDVKNEVFSAINEQKDNLLRLLANNWSSTETYNTGDYVFYPPLIEKYYKCKANGTFGSWQLDQWTEIAAGASELEGKTIEYWSFNNIYDKDEYVIYVYEDYPNVKLYKCKEDGITGAWNSSKWKEIIISDELIDNTIRMAGLTEIKPTISNNDLNGPNSASPDAEKVPPRANSKLTSLIEIPDGQTLMIYWSKCINTPGLRLHIFFQETVQDSTKWTWVGRKGITINSTSEPYILPESISNVKNEDGTNITVNTTGETIGLRISWDIGSSNGLDGLSFFLVPKSQKNDIATAFAASFTKLSNLNDSFEILEEKVGNWTNENSISSVINNLSTTTNNIGDWTRQDSITDIVESTFDATQIKNINDITEIFPIISAGDYSGENGNELTNLATVNSRVKTNQILLPEGKTLAVCWTKCIDDPGLRFHIYQSESDTWVWKRRVGRNPKYLNRDFYIFPRFVTSSYDYRSGDIKIIVSWDNNAFSSVTVDETTTNIFKRLYGLTFFIVPTDWQDNLAVDSLINITKNNNLNSNFNNSIFGIQQMLGITEIHPTIEFGNMDSYGQFTDNNLTKTTSIINVPEGQTLAVFWKECSYHPGLRFSVFGSDGSSFLKRIGKNAWEFNNVYVYQKGVILSNNTNPPQALDINNITMRVSWDYGVVKDNIPCVLDDLSFFLIPDYYFLKKYEGKKSTITEYLENAYKTLQQLIGVTEIQPIITTGEFNGDKNVVDAPARALTDFIEVPANGTIVMSWEKKNSNIGLQLGFFSSKTASTATSTVSVAEEELMEGRYTYTSTSDSTIYLRISWIRDSLEGVLFSNGSNEINNLNTQIASLNTQITSLNNQITSLNNQVTTLANYTKLGTIKVQVSDENGYDLRSNTTKTLYDLGIITSDGFYRVSLWYYGKGAIATNTGSEYIIRYANGMSNFTLIATIFESDQTGNLHAPNIDSSGVLTIGNAQDIGATSEIRYRVVKT